MQLSCLGRCFPHLWRGHNHGNVPLHIKNYKSWPVYGETYKDRVDRFPHQPETVDVSGVGIGRGHSPGRVDSIQPRKFRSVSPLPLPCPDRPVLSGMRFPASPSPVAPRASPGSPGPESSDGAVIAHSRLRAIVGGPSGNDRPSAARLPPSRKLDMGLACGNNAVLDFAEHPGLSIHRPGPITCPALPQRRASRNSSKGMSRSVRIFLSVPRGISRLPSVTGADKTRPPMSLW